MDGHYATEEEAYLQDIIDDEVTRNASGSLLLVRSVPSHLETTMTSRLIWTQQNMPNCCLRYCFLRDATKPTKPGTLLVVMKGTRKYAQTDRVEDETDEPVIRGERE